MSKSFYVFKVKYVCDDSLEEDYGITCAETFSEAVSNITEDYAEDEIDEINISPAEEGYTFTITEEMYNHYV